MSLPSVTTIMYYLLGGVGLILLYLLVLNLRNPVLVKIGLRNIPRRPAQSILIVVGLTLSTVIIVSALSIGDTLNHSVRNHTIKAYGQIDQILAPPLLSLFISLGGPEGMFPGDETEANPQADELGRLFEGGFTTLVTFLDGGLPGIRAERYEQLRMEAADEPLIDTVSGAILFPTIIRNVSTGQGEPLGFIFAVDTNYPDEFGLTSIDGRPVRMETLQTGVGNIFAQAGNLFTFVEQSAADLGLEGFRIADAALATVAIGTAVTTAIQEDSIDVAELSIDVASIAALGLDTTLLEKQGIERLSLETLGLTPDRLSAIGIQTTTLSFSGEPVVDPTLIAPDTVDPDADAPDAGQQAEGVTPLDDGRIRVGGIELPWVTQDLLAALNLNTIGRELDRVLAEFGLQLRQGEVYLSRLGAESLNARPGDVLEIYIGPLPVPFRVKDIVDEAGPAGALAPVVMLRLDEAQQLLFMRDKVNTILVSNLGDEFSGMEHTEAVTERLRVLAVDPEAVAQVEAILSRPEVLSVVRIRAETAVDAMVEDFDGPPFMLEMMQRFGAFTPFAALVQQLPTAIENQDQELLRELLADLSVREWLLSAPLQAQDLAALRTTLAQLNQFDVLEPLNKSTIILAADVAGIAFSTLFSTFGALSILAGILLIFLIFIMMAAERRSELGMARAIGLQRGHLVQMFVTEGVIYDLLAAALGVVLGLGISYTMVGFIGGLFNTISGQLTGQASLFEIQFRAAPTSLVIAYCIGVLFTFIVVTIAAWRASRLNIVAAIRDLPEPKAARGPHRIQRIWLALRGPLLLGAGAAITFLWANGDITLLRIGASIMALGLGFTLAWGLERAELRTDTIQRIAYSVVGAGLLAIWAVPWQSLELFNATPFRVGPLRLLGYILSVPMIICGAILVVMFNADLWTRAATSLLGGIGALTPVLRTAVAYPLSARFRTGMTMVLFAMIISTVTVMSLVIEMTETAVSPDEERTGGFEISASSSLLSFFDPMTDLEGAIATRPDFPRELIAGVGTVATTNLLMSLDDLDAEQASWPVRSLAGVSNGYIDQASQVYSFRLRAPGFANDEAVWDALRTRTDVVIVTADWLNRVNDRMPANAQTLPEFTLLLGNWVDFDAEPWNDGGPSRGGRLPSDVQVIHSVQVIGVLDTTTTVADETIQINLAAFSRDLNIDPSPTFFIKVAPGASVHEAAAAIEQEFIGNAIYTTVLAESFAQGQAITRGILQLLQGFLALGLVVGIAALGVISTRTVVERRQQVGMLRAIGYQPYMIALAFVLESSFIALTGLGIGVAAGIIMGQGIIENVLSAVASDVGFTVPWVQIGIMLLAAYLFALLTTIAPAYQASRIYPAEALRYE